MDEIQILYIACAAVILIGGSYVYLKIVNAKEKRVKDLKTAYDAAIASGDKKAALTAGRAYYQAFRGIGTLTIYDEQAIANDLSAM